MTDWYRANREVQTLIADAREIAHRLGVVLGEMAQGHGREPGPDHDRLLVRTQRVWQDCERLRQDMTALGQEVTKHRTRQSDQA